MSGDSSKPTLMSSVKGKCVKLSLGDYFGSVINSNGIVFTWGRNESGELGQGDFLIRQNPMPV